jgi:DNA-binding winged helix-turn-helix (wHTH) protein
MRTRITNRDKAGGRHLQSTQSTPTARDEVAQFLADIDGIPVLVRFLVGYVSAEVQSRFVSGSADLHSLLSSTVEKMVDMIGGSTSRRDHHAERALATVEFPAHPAKLPVLSSYTVLRVGPLELDLLDRTAKRGDRQIDLRPREFQLLKYMMQRSDELLTRAAILTDVWNYKFVPETNLVDVHMGKLRRKVDGSDEPTLIRNVRGVGFVLSATAISHCPTPRPAGRMEARQPDKSSRPLESALQY